GRGQRGRGAVHRAVDRQVAARGGQRRAGTPVERPGDTQGLRIGQREARGTEAAQRTDVVHAIQRRRATGLAGQGAGRDAATAAFADRTGRLQGRRGAVHRTVDGQIAGRGGQRGAGTTTERPCDSQGLRIGQGEAGRAEAAQRADVVRAGQRGRTGGLAGQRAGRDAATAAFADRTGRLQGRRVAADCAVDRQVAARGDQRGAGTPVDRPG